MAAHADSTSRGARTGWAGGDGVPGAEPVETPAAIFATIDARLRADPQRAEGREAAYAFDLSGNGGGLFHIVLAGGQGRAGAGAPDAPDVTLSMTAADFVAMTVGQLDGTLAFIEARIRWLRGICLPQFQQPHRRPDSRHRHRSGAERKPRPAAYSRRGDLGI